MHSIRENGLITYAGNSRFDQPVHLSRQIMPLLPAYNRIDLVEYIDRQEVPNQTAWMSRLVIIFVAYT